MQLNLSRLKPCDQYWANMYPDGDGRICTKCNRHIVDFRNMSNEEIALTHALSEAPVCGLYSNPQLLNSPEINPRLPQKPLAKFWPAVVTSVLGLTSADAGEPVSINTYNSATCLSEQGFQKTKHAETSNQETWQRKKFASTDSIIIQGKVLDAESDTPLPGANVIVEGKTVGAATDLDGKYTISLERETEMTEVTLIFSMIGFGRREVKVPLEASRTDLAVSLEADDFIGEVFYVVAEKPSFLKRIWNSIKSIF